MRLRQFPSNGSKLFTSTVLNMTNSVEGDVKFVGVVNYINDMLALIVSIFIYLFRINVTFYTLYRLYHNE